MDQPKPRQFNFIQALCLAAIVAILVTLLLHVVIRASSPLTRNLPSAFKEADKEFNARVQRRFPPGTPEERVIAELGDEGFSPDDRFGGDGGMARTGGNGICNLAARIYWNVDDQGDIREIRGVYREEGCL